jgi:Trypsin
MIQFGRAGRRAVLAGAAALAALAGSLAAGGTAHAIIGGDVTTTSNFPSYVKVTTGTGVCGGTLIAPTAVLTAAHCVDEGASVGSVTVFVKDSIPVPAVAITIHPLWNGDVVDGHDLAIVTLPPATTIGVPNVQVGSPFDASYYAPNTPATIVGHGSTTPSGPVSPTLQAANTVLRSDDYMDDIYNPWYWFDHWNSFLMIGAGSTTKTTCFGDSGGPLFVHKRGASDLTQVEVGVTSFTRGWPSEDCTHPGGFDELSGAQLAWVAQQVPSIKPAWGPCYQPNGLPGQASARYVSSYLPAAHTDGPYYWEIACYGIPSQPPPTTTPPPPTTDPPIPPMCRTTPWKCPDV